MAATPLLSRNEQVVELASGVDAFYFSGVGVAPDALCRQLDRLNEVAAAERMPQPVELGGAEFMVQGYGRRQHPYCLVHPYGWMGITQSERHPTFWVEPAAVALHGLGYRETVEWFEAVVRSIDPEALFGASRVDLFCDVGGWSAVVEDRDRMVSRSKQTVLHLNEGTLTGMTFGRRKSGGVMLRIYDKKRQVVEHGLDYWFPIWGDRLDPTRPVWRVEFEVGRKGLRSFGIGWTDDVYERVGALWAAITSKLFRLTVPTADQTPSRWPTDPVWALVQNAALRADAVPLDRLIEHKRAGSLRKLEGPLTGVLSSVGALSDAESIDDALDTAHDMVTHYERWSSRDFMERVTEKRRR